MEHKLYLGDGWYQDQPMSEEEKRTGYISELRIMHFLFSDLVLANTLGEKLVYTDGASAIVDAYNEDTEDYEDIYQYFIVDLSLDEDSTKAVLEAAGGLYLYYSNEYDVYILGVGDLGTSRDYVMTNIKRTTDIDSDNVLR